MYVRKGRRRLLRALATVDPSAIADSIESYVGSLTADEVRALALESSKALPQAERAQLALYMDEKALTGTSDDLLARRFTAFLRQNPRAAGYLRTEALEHIVAPLVAETTEDPSPRRFRWNALGLGILAVLVSVVPLAAQYAHQRGMLSGLRDAIVAPTLPVSIARRIAAAPKPVRPASHSRAPEHSKHRRPVHSRIAAVRPRTHKSIGNRVARLHVPRPAAPRVRVASLWKFDRRNYPYFASPRKTMQERARLEVQSYLNAVIAGDTRSALQHLGLPPDADLVNLSEVPIISRTSHARVVWVKPRPDGKTQVDADISGRNGEYFEVFYVAADGPAVRITDRYYIPVGKASNDIAR